MNDTPLNVIHDDEEQEEDFDEDEKKEHAEADESSGGSQKSIKFSKSAMKKLNQSSRTNMKIDTTVLKKLKDHNKHMQTLEDE